MSIVCEIREVSDMDKLRDWATAMEAPVKQIGTTLEGYDVYAATHDVTTLLCVVPADRPTSPPLGWSSPFE